MSLDAARAAFRKELRLPEKGRIVITGHQCSIWHAGILAKYLACDALVSQRVFDHAAWLWVDQDSDETHTVRVPVMDSRALKATAWALKRAHQDDIAACGAPAFTPAPFVGEAALPQVREGVERVRAALAAHASEPNAARQFAAALADLMTPLIERRPAAFASAFMGKSLGRALVELMLANPRRCVEAYNRAAAGTPEARVAPLARPENDADIELPLWLVGAGVPRVRVTVKRLREHAEGGATLAPRALLMTGMARLAACDLFIHGTGGGVYDAITERWFKQWLGVDLAPTRVVTADLYLPLPAPDVSERDAARARWRAAHARHDPAMLGDPAAAAEKSRLLALISETKAGGADPLPLYRAMHDLLARVRERHSSSLGALEQDAARATAGLSESRLARDRTWAFPFHSSDALAGLKRVVAANQ